MGKILIKKPGLLTTIQDDGRRGYGNYGIAESGAMDIFSLKSGNALVGNSLNEAALEITLLGPEIEFQNHSIIAITGGNLSPSLNGKSIEMWRTYSIYKGDVLSFGSCREGCRSYLCFSGGINVPKVLGSKSTYIRGKIGGNNGNKLEANYTLLIGEPIIKKKYFIRRMKKEFIPTYQKREVVRVVLGPQDDYFTDMGIHTFLSSDFIASSRIDRWAYRFEGPVIEHSKKGADIISDGIALGAVQVPANGNPIVFMSDRPTTGGYSKIATVISVDVSKIAQIKTGDHVQFKKIDIKEAQKIFKDREQFFLNLVK